jgi:Mor family transcriptional regulator
MEEFAEARGVQMLLDVANVLGEALVEEGVEQEKARQLGLLAAERLRDVYGGAALYISKTTALILCKRDLEIYDKFNGFNHPELARQFGLTERRIRQVISRVRKERMRRDQPGLPFDQDGDPEAA